MPNGHYVPDDAPAWAGYMIGQVNTLGKQTEEIKGTLVGINDRLNKSNDIDRNVEGRLSKVEADQANCPVRSGAALVKAPAEQGAPPVSRHKEIVTRGDLVKFLGAIVVVGAFLGGLIAGVLRVFYGLKIDLPGV